MNFTLVRKEIAEHGWVLLFVLPASLLGFLLILWVSSFQEAGSSLEVIRQFGFSFLLLVELVLCNRLVVQEYTKKTQLFLEGLPVSRASMLATKYLFGLTIVSVMTAGCYALALLIAANHEPLSGRFVAIVTSRLFAYVFATYSFFFMMGLLGRYRMAIYFSLFVTVTAIAQSSSLDLSSQGPWALLDDQFAYERDIFPTAKLLSTLEVGAGCLTVSALLALVREGTVAGMLAEKMSYREKVFVAASILTLMWTLTVLDEKESPDPYSIVDAITLKGDGFEVQVESADSEAAVQLADQAFADLSSIRTYLGLTEPVDLFLANRSDLDVDQFETAQLKNASGVLIRVNYNSENWDYRRFRPYMIDVYLSEATGYTAIYEPHCWVLEGFSEYWPRREAFGTDFQLESKSDLRAAYAKALGTEAIDLRDWYQFRERLGQPIVRSVACSGLVLAERKYGRDRVALLLKHYLSGQVPVDFRADWLNVMRPIGKVWQQTFNDDYDQFCTEWMGELDLVRDEWAEQLAAIPRLTAKSTVNVESDVSCEIRMVANGESMPEDSTIEVLFEEISPYDTWEDDRTAKSQVELYEPNQPITLGPMFSRGDRVRWTTRVYAPLLESHVISGWQRQEVK